MKTHNKINQEDLMAMLPNNNDIKKVLSKKHQLVLGYLLLRNGMDKVKKDGYFFMDNKRIMNEVGISEHTLIAAMNKLSILGFITRIAGARNSQKTRSSEYRIYTEYIENFSLTPTEKATAIPTAISTEKATAIPTAISTTIPTAIPTAISDFSSSENFSSIEKTLAVMMLEINNLKDSLKNIEDLLKNQNCSTDTDIDTDIEKDIDIYNNNINKIYNNNIKENNLNKEKENIINNIKEKEVMEKLETVRVEERKMENNNIPTVEDIKEDVKENNNNASTLEVEANIKENNNIPTVEETPHDKFWRMYHQCIGKLQAVSDEEELEEKVGKLCKWVEGRLYKAGKTFDEMVKVITSDVLPIQDKLEERRKQAQQEYDAIVSNAFATDTAKAKQHQLTEEEKRKVEEYQQQKEANEKWAAEFYASFKKEKPSQEANTSATSPSSEEKVSTTTNTEKVSENAQECVMDATIQKLCQHVDNVLESWNWIRQRDELTQEWVNVKREIARHTLPIPLRHQLDKKVEATLHQMLSQLDE